MSVGSCVVRNETLTCLRSFKIKDKGFGSVAEVLPSNLNKLYTEIEDGELLPILLLNLNDVFA